MAPAVRALHFTTVTQAEFSGLQLAKQKVVRERETLNTFRRQQNLPPLDVAAINRTKVPVLTVVRGAAFANVRIHTTSDHFVASGGSAKQSFVLSGTRIALKVPHPAQLRPMGDRLNTVLKSELAARGATDPITDVEVTRAEDGVIVTFRRYGAIYELRLSCEDTEAAECSREEALRLLATTTMVGGGS